MVVISVKTVVLIQVSIIVLSSFYELSHGEVGIENVFDEPVLEPLSFKFGRKRPPPSRPPKQQQPSPPRPFKSPPPSPPSPPPPVNSPPPSSWTPPPSAHAQPPPPRMVPTVVSDYHLMQYVLQWAPTTCIKKQKCKVSFLNPRANVFSLHGLWPANSIGHSLNCPEPEFTTVGNVWANDNTLKSELQDVWPNLLGTDEGFWIHEWKKHGYCTNTIIKDVDYFKAAITINSMIEDGDSKTNLVGYLEDANIHPSNSSFHSKTDIMRALYPLVGTNNEVYVSCEEIDNQVHLKEIYLCLDKSLQKFISCPQTHANRGCGPSPNNIVIPAF